jgi:hypothetical protein
MKIKKIILLSLVAVFLSLTPFRNMNAFAYDGGILHGKSLILAPAVTQSGTSTSAATDGSLGTSVTLEATSTSKDTLYYSLDADTTIDSYRVNADNPIRLAFYDRNANLISSLFMELGDGKRTINPVENVRYVALINEGVPIKKVYEFDVFGVSTVDLIPPGDVKNLTSNSITETSFNITFTAPTDIDLNQFKIYVNGTLKATIPKTSTSYSLIGLNSDTSYSIRVTSVDTSNNESLGQIISVKTNIPPDVTAPSNVTNLTAKPTFKSVSLSWTNPPETDFAMVKIYENGVYQKSVTASEESTALFDNLDSETSYTFKVTSIDNTGNESVGSSIQVSTLPLPVVKNIKGLDADAKYDRVKLSWKLPEDEYFHHVNIYRKVATKESFLKDLFSLGVTKVYADDTSDGYTPMFETNGTFWTDLTVNPDTNYEYKLTSENTDGRESTGVTVAATTPQEPKPKIEGAVFTTSTNGDYVVTWEQPTKGSIKLFVGEEEYKTVQASQGSYTIPKADLKYTTLGDPDIKIQPITERGTIGDSISNPKSNLPFSVKDLIESGNGLLWLISPFILLALAFLLVPKLRNLIVAAFRGNKNTMESNSRRFQTEEKASKGNLKEERVQTPREPRQPKMPRIKPERTEREVRAIRETRQSNREPREPRRRRGS